MVIKTSSFNSFETFMNHYQIFLRALLAGMIVSAPIGPVGVVTIRYAVLHKGIARFAAAFGMITADLIYTFLFIFDKHFVSFIEKKLPSHEMALHFSVGILVLLIGLRLILQKRASNKTEQKILYSQHVFFTTFGFALLNPLNLLGFLLVLTILGLIHVSLSLTSRFLVLIGMICGASTWWPFILFWIRKNQKNFDHKLINRITGIILIIIGIYYIINMFVPSFLP